MDHVWHAESNCCTKLLSDEELEALNDCFESTSDLTDIDRSTVYYVAGYICHKENLSQNLDEHSVPQNTAASEFTKELLRGNLSHPPLYLYNFGLYLLVYYKSVIDKSCLKRIMLAFNEIYVAIRYDIHDANSILRRFANTFMKAFGKAETEKDVQGKKAKAIKRMRLEH